MERIFRRKNNIQSKSTVAAKTGFPPFARRSLPSGNSGVPIRAASPVVRESAHENKRFLRKQKPQHAKHAGIRAASPAVRGSAQKTVSKLPEFSKKIAKKRTKVLEKLHLFRKLSKICLSKNEKPKICGFYSLFFFKKFVLRLKKCFFI